MQVPESYLTVKRSQIPKAGKGLFTKEPILKGSLIIEYKGRKTTWKAVQQSKEFNGYVYYITRNHVINAMPYKKYLARYANDATGLSKIKGLKNNCTYIMENGKVFIKALRAIKAGEEILVAYGKEYWDVIRYNNKLSLKNQEQTK